MSISSIFGLRIFLHMFFSFLLMSIAFFGLVFFYVFVVICCYLDDVLVA